MMYLERLKKIEENGKPIIAEGPEAIENKD